jgi:hypothetical protein
MSAGPDGALAFDAWVPLEGGKGSLPLLWALGNDWTQPPTDAAQVRGPQRRRGAHATAAGCVRAQRASNPLPCRAHKPLRHSLAPCR